MGDELKPVGSKRGHGEQDLESIKDLLERAHKGDKDCIPKLRELFNEAKATDLVNACGSPPEWLEVRLLNDAAGANLAVREASSLKLARIRRGLEGPDPSPTERLLAERAAICWWPVHRYEATYAGAEGLSFKQSEFHQSRIDKAHGRFLSSLRTLATVRKLALPALQVIIARNHVNTMGSEVGR